LKPIKAINFPDCRFKFGFLAGFVVPALVLYPMLRFVVNRIAFVITHFLFWLKSTELAHHFRFRTNSKSTGAPKSEVIALIGKVISKPGI
jgi:hypothetical protein